MMSKKIYIFLFISFHYSISCLGQTYKKEFTKIDSLFLDWNSTKHPGGSVSVIKNGKILFSKSYGVANLECGELNSKNTLFNIGSISKQFTALGILILEKQNKLSLNDDIKNYIYNFPNFKKKITIQNLLHHTSGLRDTHGLLALSGWKKGDIERNEDILRIIKNQNELNFNPGEEFMYSNTGYILLAKIIENITNEPFHIWMKNNVFQPLGLKNTYVRTSENSIDHKSTSYNFKNSFIKVNEYWNYYGSGNIYSTSEDVAKWGKNFYSKKNKWSLLFKRLLKVATLNNRVKTNYGFGVQINQQNDKTFIEHGGSIGGFKSITKTFLQEKLNIVILSNFSNSNVKHKAEEIYSIVIEKSSERKLISNKISLPKIIKFPTEELLKLEGIYWSNEEKIGRKIYVKKDTLRYFKSEKNEWPLIPINKNTFIIKEFSSKIKFNFDNENNQMVINRENETPGVFKRIERISQEKISLNNFSGIYFSEELNTTYKITEELNYLYIEHARHGKMKLNQKYNTKFTSKWPLNTVEFVKDKNDSYSGLKISNGRTRDVYFKKVIFE